MKSVAAITGAYGGLGAALSTLLAGSGYRLVIGGRSKERLERFAAQLSKRTDVASVVMDVRKPVECARPVQAAMKKFGRLDLLINNAGVWRPAPIRSVTPGEVETMLETNLSGPIFCARAAVKVMRRQGSGHILNIGSTSAVDYKSAHIAYGASKAGLVGFSGCLRKELEGTGIRVSVFSPGGMKTGLFRSHPAPPWLRDDFMDPAAVAAEILKHARSAGDPWHVVFRRGDKKRHPAP